MEKIVYNYFYLIFALSGEIFFKTSFTASVISIIKKLSLDQSE